MSASDLQDMIDAKNDVYTSETRHSEVRYSKKSLADNNKIGDFRPSARYAN